MTLKLKAGMIVTDEIAKLMSFKDEWVLDYPLKEQHCRIWYDTLHPELTGKACEEWSCFRLNKPVGEGAHWWTLIIDLVLDIPANAELAGKYDELIERYYQEVINEG